MRSSRVVASALAAVAILAASSSALAEPASFRLPDVGAIAITVDGGHVRAHLMPRPRTSPSRREGVAVDRRLAIALHRASQLVAVAGRGFVEAGRTFVVLGAAIPSVAKPGLGYCGAGTEDYLLLIEWKTRPRRLELRDRVQVQSCLQSMALESDQGSELPVVLRGIDDPGKATLTWLQHPRYGPATKTVTAPAGKFVVLP